MSDYFDTRPPWEWEDTLEEDDMGRPLEWVADGLYRYADDEDYWSCPRPTHPQRESLLARGSRKSVAERVLRMIGTIMLWLILMACVLFVVMMAITS